MQSQRAKQSSGTLPGKENEENTYLDFGKKWGRDSPT
jgi:hypothetical protein